MEKKDEPEERTASGPPPAHDVLPRALADNQFKLELNSLGILIIRCESIAVSDSLEYRQLLNDARFHFDGIYFLLQELAWELGYTTGDQSIRQNTPVIGENLVTLDLIRRKDSQLTEEFKILVTTDFEPQLLVANRHVVVSGNRNIKRILDNLNYSEQLLSNNGWKYKHALRYVVGSMPAVLKEYKLRKDLLPFLSH